LKGFRKKGINLTGTLIVLIFTPRSGGLSQGWPARNPLHFCNAGRLNSMVRRLRG